MKWRKMFVWNYNIRFYREQQVWYRMDCGRRGVQENNSKERRSSIFILIIYILKYRIQVINKGNMRFYLRR